MRALPFLALFVLLAGCAQPSAPEESTQSVAAAAPPRPMDWTPGNWWAYHATVGNETVDVALILHEKTATGYLLGSNLSVGFFGLPFHGNVTPDRNPRIGADVWPLFQFPLADGKEWGYTLFGYDAQATSHAGDVSIPGLGARPGYRMEATSFGQTFARYTYSPEVGWFTHLEVIEPTDGSKVLVAELTAYGPDWGSAYFVEETLYQLRIDYPEVPSIAAIDVPAGYLDVRVELTGHSSAGILFATLRDEDGRRLASIEVLGKGFDTERAAVDAVRGAQWHLEHRGVGTGSLYLEVTGLSATGPLAQSTRPALPQEGQTTSTGLPVGSYEIAVPQSGHRVEPILAAAGLG